MNQKQYRKIKKIIYSNQKIFLIPIVDIDYYSSYFSKYEVKELFIRQIKIIYFK